MSRKRTRCMRGGEFGDQVKVGVGIPADCESVFSTGYGI